jgi:anti-sigma regulatory factor (Ser/Thr protein kinase)
MIKSVRQETVHIRQFLIETVGMHPNDLVSYAAEKLRLSRQAVYRHVIALIENGVLDASGRTHARKYELKPIASFSLCYKLAGLAEHVPWERDVKPLIDSAPKNVLRVCAFAFTEMLNNAIDHSESEYVQVDMTYTAESISFEIHDRGVGIFRKIKRERGLEHERFAILELAKGKLTTDPDRHTGEGIFFTSRMVDLFSIWSGNLYFTHFRPDNDWLNEDNRTEMDGTLVSLCICLRSKLNPTDVFDEFSSGDDATFSKTQVPLKLAQFGEDNLISRSQAKRVAERFDRFKEVVLDFTGVEFIGQGFADQLFRVYQKAHPDVTLIPYHANPAVRSMIMRARHGAGQLELFDRNA